MLTEIDTQISDDCVFQGFEGGDAGNPNSSPCSLFPVPCSEVPAPKSLLPNLN
ncbi:hypothetical protein BJP36_42900 [Moorena producens JHB]|uniref:Uncharacterized protein n=1 Tax=Moorena producens (strain JHB) TaxID=1454205 RepID=A0A9Q9ST05_MOOP1|nr:hypothetical protein [Moorena producens]WAN69114.1 hypothetical protein BJP36_42900 [Moorena producens JHB]